jgi:hypothetical protein
MDPVATAARVGPPVASLGGKFMLDEETTARGASLDLSFPEFYMCGRGSVLGDVDADVVSAAFVYFPVPVVRMMWEGGRAKHAPADIVDPYAEACRAYGRAHFAGAPDLDDLAKLLEQVVAGASPLAAPLFAGWRAVPLPDDAPGRVAQLLHVLREHRGGAHAVAVLAAGLTPLEAVIGSGDIGVAQAQLFGWPEPYPDPAATASVRAEAEKVTDRLAAPAFEVLTPDERTQLAELLDGLSAAAS